MSAWTREMLWMRLRDAGVAEGEMPAPDSDRSPWFVRVMLGLAGWVGAIFLLGFVGVGFVFVMESAAASLLVGALACAGAAAIFRADPRGGFTAQFGLAVSLAGQALMVYGLIQSFERSLAAIALGVAVQQALLFLFVPNFVHRVWTAWSGTFALSIALSDAGLAAFAPAAVTGAFIAVWLREFNHARRGELLRSGGYGLALAAVQTSVLHAGLWHAMVWGRRTDALPDPHYMSWLGAAASATVLLCAVAGLLRRERVALGSGPGRIALVGAAILGLASLKAPGVAPAAAILVIGYANGNRVLAGLGIAALLGYLSHYYYSLEATLLAKSALLAFAGLALLAVRLALRLWWPAKEAQHA